MADRHPRGAGNLHGGSRHPHRQCRLALHRRRHGVSQDEAKRPQAFALFGVAVVVAPVVGPTLGGWLSDNYSWHWCFLINGPVGLLAMVLISLLLREPAAAVEERQRVKEQGL